MICSFASVVVFRCSLLPNNFTIFIIGNRELKTKIRSHFLNSRIDQLIAAINFIGKIWQNFFDPIKERTLGLALSRLLSQKPINILLYKFKTLKPFRNQQVSSMFCQWSTWLGSAWYPRHSLTKKQPWWTCHQGVMPSCCFRSIWELPGSNW